MPRTMQQRLPALEDNRVDLVDPSSEDTDNKVDRVYEVPMRMAKAAVGRAVKEAIGARPLKEFGEKGHISNVLTGEKVPEYLARIYQDTAARRRLAFALLRGDPLVRTRVVIDYYVEE